jgi:hypothetical protein
VRHLVAAGETSWEIAERYGVAHAALVLSNGQLGRIDLPGGHVSFVDLYAGDELAIPGTLGDTPPSIPQNLVNQLPADAQNTWNTSAAEAGDVAGAYQTLVDLGNDKLCKNTNAIGGCSDADAHRLFKLYAVGLNFIVPGLGSVWGAFLNVLWDFGTQVVAPILQALGLYDFYACKSSGTWQASDVLAASNYGSDVPTQPQASFGATTMFFLALSKALYLNCKSTVRSADALASLVAVWNATHEGPAVAVYVPTFAEVHTHVSPNGAHDYPPSAIFGVRSQVAAAFAPASMVDTSPSGWGYGGTVVSVNYGKGIQVVPIHFPPRPPPAGGKGAAAGGVPTAVVVAGVAAAAGAGLWLLLGRPLSWEAFKAAMRGATHDDDD